MSRALITGMGVISPLGDSAAELAAALAAGRSGLGPVELFDPGDLACREAGEVRRFEPRDYLGDGNLRPLDRTALLAASAAQLALADSRWTEEVRGGREMGLVLGTTFGSVHTIAAFDRRALTAGPIYAKPLDFANSVINAAAGQTAIWHRLEGVNSTISGGTTSGVQALGYASDLIRNGRATVLLAGGGEELCYESFYGFDRCGLMAGSGDGGPPCAVPFDARRNGFVLAEGAALLMLEDEATAAERRSPVRAEIRGWGMSYDPSRGREVERAAQAVARAVRAALGDAGLPSSAIDAVSASASGGVAADRAEARGLAAVLDHRPPVTAVKSMLGEGLGASGALQTVALLQAMESGVLPGVRGLEKLEDGMPPEMVAAGSREVQIRRGLVTAVGLDGQAAALVVERREGA